MLKCFTLEYDGEEKRKVKSMDLIFNLHNLRMDWPGYSGAVSKWTIITFIHYPGQFYLHKMNDATAWTLKGLSAISNIFQVGVGSQ